ncbi:hypothetical protein FW774_01135 (plasmid) [Pedobacter sp. BS3]|uniref:hypothetical protein n=1 Tax=Pedobacter sp. BS3 TaxID=2567937 RepID=UPI0011F05159|nr:hypothetical protein [Pedobacter sp. BS3]TZF85710.1 hypothetical protein FW774_01135 [Pedobacter sp. BS3]
MKKPLFSIILTLLIGSLITVICSFILPINHKVYYYAYNEKVYIKKLDSKVAIRYKNSEAAQLSNAIAQKSKNENFEIKWQDSRTIVINTNSVIKADSLITPLA